MRTKRQWYTAMAIRWIIGIALVLAGRWLVGTFGWPWWAVLIVELVLATLILAFVIQWPLSYNEHVRATTALEERNPIKDPANS